MLASAVWAGSVCLSVHSSIPILLHVPGCNLGNGRPYWADLQSVHGFRCCYNIAPNMKCQQVLLWLPIVDMNTRIWVCAQRDGRPWNIGGALC